MGVGDVVSNYIYYIVFPNGDNEHQTAFKIIICTIYLYRADCVVSILSEYEPDKSKRIALSSLKTQN